MIARMPGQTLTEIRGLLALAGLAPQHRLGQNFLIDLNLMRKLVGAGEVVSSDTVLEVGPGTGSLTECLLAQGATVVAVEIDRGLQDLLRARLGGEARFRLVAGDALAGKHRVSPAVVEALRSAPPRAGGHYKLVANLPYQVATPLLIDLLLGQLPFERLACTIQREVGERLIAEAGTEAYGVVSVLAASLADVEIVARVPATAFWPAPKVESVMLRVRPKPSDAREVADVAAFVALVQRAFQQRRKMLRRALAEVGAAAMEACLTAAEASATSRPEDLTPAQWRRLFAALPACRAGDPPRTPR